MAVSLISTCFSDFPRLLQPDEYPSLSVHLLLSTPLLVPTPRYEHDPDLGSMSISSGHFPTHSAIYKSNSNYNNYNKPTNDSMLIFFFENSFNTSHLLSCLPLLYIYHYILLISITIWHIALDMPCQPVNIPL